MSAYDELVERCAKLEIANHKEKCPWSEEAEVTTYWRDSARLVLAEVRRTLETVTPEMVEAWVDEPTPDQIAFPTSREYAEGSWLAMLHVSPLEPPK